MTVWQWFRLPWWGAAPTPDLSAITRRVETLEQQGRDIMGTVADLEAKNVQLVAKLNELTEATTHEREEVQALVGGLRNDVQALKDQLGTVVGEQLVSQEKLDALNVSADTALASATALLTKVQAISEPLA